MATFTVGNNRLKIALKYVKNKKKFKLYLSHIKSFEFKVIYSYMNSEWPLIVGTW